MNVHGVQFHPSLPLLDLFCPSGPVYFPSQLLTTSIGREVEVKVASSQVETSNLPRYQSTHSECYGVARDHLEGRMSNRATRHLALLR